MVGRAVYTNPGLLTRISEPCNLRFYNHIERKPCMSTDPYKKPSRYKYRTLTSKLLENLRFSTQRQLHEDIQDVQLLEEVSRKHQENQLIITYRYFKPGPKEPSNQLLFNIQNSFQRTFRIASNERTNLQTSSQRSFKIALREQITLKNL